jgi:anti-sigma factor ChrR (cupin superfamily)
MEPGEMAVEGPYFRAVLAVHHGRFDECALHVDRARQLLHNTLSALMAESYKRAYTSLVLVQQLAEVEEVVALKKLEVNPSRVEDAASARLQLKDKWDRRLSGCRLEVTPLPHAFDSFHAYSRFPTRLSFEPKPLTFLPAPCTGCPFRRCGRGSGF